MNLLCPNCQKMLTVPEQYAGQMMKCPLCAGTFTVPGLPAATLPPPPPPVETIPFQADPVPPPPPPPPPSPVSTSTPPAIVEKPLSTAPAWTPPPPPPPPGDYTRTYSVWLSPKVLVWLPAPALLLIFVLSFFPWVGIYPGGVAAVWQNAWQAAFAYYGEDKDMQSEAGPGYKIVSENDLKKKDESDKVKVVDNRPTWSPGLVLYLLLFLFTLAVTVLVTVVGLLPIKLPPPMQQFLPWRWAVVAGLNLLTLLLLSLSLVFGFSLENKFTEYYKARIATGEEFRKENKTTVPKVVIEAEEGIFASADRQTAILKVVVFLHLLALVVSLLMLWLNHREKIGRPVPRFDLQV